MNLTLFTPLLLPQSSLSGLSSLANTLPLCFPPLSSAIADHHSFISTFSLCFSYLPSMFSTQFILTFFLLLSLTIVFLLAPLFTSAIPLILPISSPDELEDLALFNRAASQSKYNNPSSFSHLASSKSQLKIAFLFLTNSDLYFAPLWNQFFPNNSDLYNVYVHADPSVNVTRPGGAFLGSFIAAKRTYRASPTLISATRRLLATALIDDPANAYFAVLSQYCVPLHSFEYVYRSLFSSKTFDSSSKSESQLTLLGVRLRFKSFIEIFSKDRNLWKRYNSRGRFSLMPEIPFDKFRVGSQFFVLTRHHALFVVKDRKLWNKFKLPCYRENQCYPEEHYFPTLLSMADPNGCTQYTLTRVNWTGTINGHPYTYRPAEISTELIHQLRKSNYSESYLFARKFTADCLKPLMAIANAAIFHD